MRLKGLTFTQTRSLNNFLRNWGVRVYIIYSHFFNLLRNKPKNFFTTVDLEVTTKCNRRCSYCPVSTYSGNSKLDYMSYDVFKNIISQLANLNYAGELIFGGFGEPLLHNDIMFFLQYARKKLKKALIGVHTNGDFFSNDFLNFLLKYDIRAYVTLHDKSEKSRKFIKKYSKSKQVFIRKQTPNDYLTTCGGLVKVKKKEVKKICIYSSLMLTINSSGDVILCCEDFYSRNKFGNVLNEPLIDIWNKPRFKKIRDDLYNGKHELDICRHCFSK